MYYGGTPRYDARIDVEILGTEREHYLETTIPVLISRLQRPDSLLVYASLLDSVDRKSYDPGFVLGAEEFERFTKRIRFGMMGDSRLVVSYVSPDSKSAEKVLQGVWGLLKAHATAIDAENAPTEAKVLRARLEKKTRQFDMLERKVRNELMIPEPRTVPPRMRTPENIEKEIADLEKAINIAEETYAEVSNMYDFRQQQHDKIISKDLPWEEVRTVSPTLKKIRERIGELKAQLAELMVDASELHPLVLDLKSTIVQLEQSKLQLSESAFVSDKVIYRPNPEYTGLQAEIRELEGTRVRLRGKINYFTSRRSELQGLLYKNEEIVKAYRVVAPERKRLAEEIAELGVKTRAAEAAGEVTARHRARLDVDNSKLLILRRSLSAIYGIPFAWAIAGAALIGFVLTMLMALTDSSVRNAEDLSDIEIPMLGAVGEVGWGFRNLRDWVLVGALIVLLGAYGVILVIREGGQDASEVVEAVARGGGRIKLTIEPTKPPTGKTVGETTEKKKEPIVTPTGKGTGIIDKKLPKDEEDTSTLDRAGFEKIIPRKKEPEQPKKPDINRPRLGR